MIQFPYYSGNIKRSEVLGLISLDDFIEMNRNPDFDTLQLLAQIEAAVLNDDIEEKKKLKTQLPAFTPSVMIEVGKRRVYKNITEFTGLMQIDLDGIRTEQEATDLKEHIFHQHEEIVCAFLSPSKRGVKALMKIIPPKYVDHYKALHKSVEIEFAEYGYFDTSTKNPILPMFLSCDTDILFRKPHKAETWFKSTWEKPTPIHVSDIPIDIKPGDENYEKVARILCDSINNIFDNGHPQVVRASLILGSRVGAGYIPEYLARDLIERLITNNNYLSKGTSGYIKTAMWGVDNGIKNPKYYKE